MFSPRPALVLDDPLLEGLAEGDEERDRDRSPGDPEERQQRPEALVADVLEDLAEKGEVGHEWRSGATRSSWEAARRPAPSPSGRRRPRR